MPRWVSAPLWVAAGLAGSLLVLPALRDPTVLALAAFGFAAAALFLTRPAVPYFLSVALMSFRSVQVNWVQDERINFSIVEPVLLVSLGCWIIARRAGRARAYPGTVSDLPIAVLFLLNCVSLLWSGDRTFGVYISAMLLLGIVIYFLTVANVQSFPAVKLAVAVYLLMAVAAGFHCFYVLYSSGKEWSSALYDNSLVSIWLWFNPEGQMRGQGFMHPLRTSYYLSISTLLSLVYVARSTGSRRWLASLLSFFLFCALLTTLSKGPLLSLFAGLLALSLAVPALRRRFVVTWLAIVGLLVLGFLAGRIPTGDVSKSLDYTLQTATDQYNETSSLGSRIIRWRQGLHAIYDTWGRGTGAGGFFPYTEPFQLFDNVYVHMLVEYGFLGLCLYLWLLLSSLKRFVTAHAGCREPAVRTWMLIYACGFVTVVFNGLTSENQLFLSIWFYLGLGHALARIAEQGGRPAAPSAGGGRVHALPA